MMGYEEVGDEFASLLNDVKFFSKQFRETYPEIFRKFNSPTPFSSSSSSGGRGQEVRSPYDLIPLPTNIDNFQEFVIRRSSAHLLPPESQTRQRIGIQNQTSKISGKRAKLKNPACRSHSLFISLAQSRAHPPETHAITVTPGERREGGGCASVVVTSSDKTILPTTTRLPVKSASPEE